jgi:hypothetical protein
MQAEGQLFVYNSSCPLDNQEFQNDVAFALANVTDAINVTAVLAYCYSSYTVTNYTLTLPIEEANKYEDDGSLFSLSTAVAAELRNQGYNNSRVELLVAMLLFNPVDGVLCTLKFNYSACHNGTRKQMYEVKNPAQFGGNCTIPEPIFVNCDEDDISSSDLSSRQIAGIISGTVIGFLLILAFLVCVLCQRYCPSRRAAKGHAEDHTPTVAVKA